MVVFSGTSNYGLVARSPGEFLVLTRFFHVNWVPIFPEGSFLVLDGSLAKSGEFRGAPIGLDWRSVLAGYGRVWLPLVAFAAAGWASIGCGIAAGEAGRGGAAAMAITAGGLLAFAAGLATILAAPGRLAALGVGLFLATALAAGAASVVAPWPPNAQAGRAEAVYAPLAVACSCAIAVAGLRRWDFAGRERADALARRAGFERPRAPAPDTGFDPATGRPDPHL